MDGPPASQAKALALEWLVKRILFERFRERPNPVDEAQAFKSEAEDVWEAMAIQSLKGDPRLFDAINSTTGELSAILEEVVEMVQDAS